MLLVRLFLLQRKLPRSVLTFVIDLVILRVMTDVCDVCGKIANMRWCGEHRVWQCSDTCANRHHIEEHKLRENILKDESDRFYPR